MAGVYSDSDPPRKTMRRGVLMTLLQQSAMTLPLWIGKPGERWPHRNFLFHHLFINSQHFLITVICTKAINCLIFLSLCCRLLQPTSSVRRYSSQQRLCGQTGRQGGSEGEGSGWRWAVDPGRSGQLQPLHQQVRKHTKFIVSEVKGWEISADLTPFLFFFYPRYEVDDIDEEGKEWVHISLL